jgi:predicted pyridoxine 5'-phosphate oxidase superfamily flavin-nucleotide-binding protein
MAPPMPRGAMRPDNDKSSRRTPMSRLFGDNHRALQDQFGTRRIADRIEQIAARTDLGEQEAAFIASRDMFFLSTINAAGQPTVSYKGGETGFVRVPDPNTIVFPSYDGNGMYLSMGNIALTGLVGMLFIDFETPHRMRVQGRATVSATDPLLQTYKDAELIVRVAVSDVWINCPRYVHKYARLAQSRYAPTAACETPLAEWKRIDILQEDLPAKDAGRAEKAGGIITMEQWFKSVGEGNG